MDNDILTFAAETENANGIRIRQRSQQPDFPEERLQLPRREEFYRRGAAALTRLYGREMPYACPQCLDLFDRADLESKNLTLEHVPPASIGGSEICLTCRVCNNTAGSDYEFSLSEAAKLREMYAALRGQSTYTGPVRVAVAGIETNATIVIADGKVELAVYESRNNPGTFRQQLGSYGARASDRDDPVQLKVSGSVRADARSLFISHLRSAYLAAFSFFGYSYILDTKLDVVRQQLLNSKDVVVPNSAALLSGDLPFVQDAPMIFIASAPLPAVVVALPFGPGTDVPQIWILLPWISSPTDFYAALDNSYIGAEIRKRALHLEASKIGWPTGPLFCLDDQ